jgi:hypothetical protein
MQSYTGKVVLASFALSILISGGLENSIARSPANMDEGFELTIQNIATSPGSKLESLDNASIRAVFNNKEVVKVNGGEKISLAAGESKRLDAVLEIKNSWIKQDGLEFRIEIVKSGFFESVVLRCATISKGISVYNRAYTCTVPSEQTAVLTYRVARKGAPLPEEAPQGLAKVGN